MNIIKLVMVFLVSFVQILGPYFGFIFHGGVGYLYEDWSEDMPYTKDYAIELEKNPDEDFVILSLTDIQLSGDEVFSETGENTYNQIAKTIEETNPDLIVLVGDNCSSDVGYLELIDFMDGFEIPWAPVMGNHDGGNGEKWHEGWDAYQLTKSEYCLFKVGPAGMGYGNYIVNITENDKVIHTVFLMDSHSSAEDTDASAVNIGKNEDGSDNIGYDHFWANQLAWYKWAVEGIAAQEGHVVESSVYMHIPVIQYREARDLMCDTVKDEEGNITEWYVKDEYKDTCFGTLHEGVCSPEGDNGFFALCKELGSTKDMIVGHDHTNDMSLLYDGIRLSYCLKSGYGSYWEQEKQGGSLLTVNSNGETTFSHHECCILSAE